jgi:DNA recombination protein RmuC
MDIILVILLVLLIGIASSILYLNLKSKPEDDKENKEAEEIANLKIEIQNLKDTLNNTINTSLGSMSTSFNNLSTGVTKDMTEALTKVDEKVGNFNHQVQLLNQSQEGITKILAGETLKANNLRILKDGEILKSEACMMTSKLFSKKPSVKKLVKLLSKN